MPLLKLNKHRQQRIVLDVSLGFAAGVMLAASFWSLLDPAVELSRASATYGDSYAWFPPAAGFIAGCLFIYASDRLFVGHAVDHDPRKQRLWLLIIAITLHNAPEGLAVGVGFGSIGRVAGATFARARNLAIGIGLQNFPEGLAVSMPLYRAGVPLWQCVFYGQLSGMVEPICGVLGAYAVTQVEPLLPYALAFAAGAMIYVVVCLLYTSPSPRDRG